MKKLIEYFQTRRYRRYKKMLIKERIKKYPHLPLSVLGNVDREIILLVL